jgi:solute carrier family 35 protein F5
LLNAVLGTVLSDYLWLWSMLLTSPLVCTLGLSLSIPVAMLSDWLLGNAQQGYSLIYVCGAVLVICGFLAVNAPERIQKKFTLSRKLSINAQPPSS